MQVVPICIVACLLVVSLYGKVEECKLSDPVIRTKIDNKIETCRCEENKYGYNIWSCDRLACRCINKTAEATIEMVTEQCKCIVEDGYKVWSCQLSGCTFNHEYFKPGAIDGGCECKKGPDPDIPKDASRYHWSCTECSHGLPSQNYKINAKWTATVDKITKTCTCVRPRKGQPKVICDHGACDKRVDASTEWTVLGACRCIGDDGGFHIWMCS